MLRKYFHLQTTHPFTTSKSTSISIQFLAMPWRWRCCRCDTSQTVVLDISYCIDEECRHILCSNYETSFLDYKAIQAYVETLGYDTTSKNESCKQTHLSGDSNLWLEDMLESIDQWDLKIYWSLKKEELRLSVIYKMVKHRSGDDAIPV